MPPARGVRPTFRSVKVPQGTEFRKELGELRQLAGRIARERSRERERKRSWGLQNETRSRQAVWPWPKARHGRAARPERRADGQLSRRVRSRSGRADRGGHRLLVRRSFRFRPNRRVDRCRDRLLRHDVANRSNETRRNGGTNRSIRSIKAGGTIRTNDGKFQYRR